MASATLEITTSNCLFAYLRRESSFILSREPSSLYRIRSIYSTLRCTGSPLIEEKAGRPPYTQVSPREQHHDENKTQVLAWAVQEAHQHKRRKEKNMLSRSTRRARIFSQQLKTPQYLQKKHLVRRGHPYHFHRQTLLISHPRDIFCVGRIDLLSIYFLLLLHPPAFHLVILVR